MNLAPLSNTPDLSERAYQAIKESILSLQAKPGEILSTGRLAEQLNISRTPVREALLRLEIDGLVTLLPQKGAVVTGICTEDIIEIYEMRIVLESYATKLAATKLTDAELENLRQIMQKAQQAFDRGEKKLASNIARELHDILIAAVDNRRLRIMLDDLESHYKRIRLFSVLIPGRLEISFQQHQVILVALEARDPNRAERAMADHLLSVREDILASMDSWPRLLDTATGPNLNRVILTETDVDPNRIPSSLETRSQL